jgi:menaquinone-specific isochorismate synthase
VTSVASPLARLRAVTRAFDAPSDLLDARGPDGFAWLHDGSGLVTSGVAGRVAVDDVDAALGAMDVDDPLGWPGTGPLAVGALAFDPAAPGSLVIPTTVVGRTAEGRGWVTEVGPPAHLRVPAPAATRPTRWRIDRDADEERWRTMVGQALRAIDAGELEKVVLARAVVVEADAPFPVSALLARLQDAQPGCFVHHAEGLLGASPELLVRRVGQRVESRPLAGTTRARVGALSALRDSVKDSREHRLVVDGVLEALAPVCDELNAAREPDAVTFSSIVHLETPVHGQLSEPAASALDLARRLHPTPAVAGTPRDVALTVIAALEPDRGRYAGPVGWVDARGDGEWAVALRGAELNGNRAVLRAGAGIVAGSDADAEWAETQAKLEPMLHALICA